MKIPVLLTVAALIAVGFGDAMAETSGESRLAILVEAVRTLEQRVAVLEDQLRVAKPLTDVAPGKANWRKLRNDMSEGDVEQLLGSRTKVDNFGSFIVGYYGDGFAGRVKFDGRSRTVTAWQEP